MRNNLKVTLQKSKIYIRRRSGHQSEKDDPCNMFSTTKRTVRTLLIICSEFVHRLSRTFFFASSNTFFEDSIIVMFMFTMNEARHKQFDKPN